jgi:hypothetical protein
MDKRCGRCGDIETNLWEMAKEASDDWFRKQTRNEFCAYYLYFTPSTETEWGSLAIAEKTPEGYQLADPRRLYPGWSRTQVKNHIRGILQHLPILPYGI